MVVQTGGGGEKKVVVTWRGGSGDVAKWRCGGGRKMGWGLKTMRLQPVVVSFCCG